MKIIYCINSLKNSGGTERIISEKANYLAERFGYDVSIITTDQNEESIFFRLNKKIKHVDLGINYFQNQKASFFKRVVSQIQKKRIHKKKLKEALLKEKADIVISVGHEEFSFLWKVADGSKKIREYHFQKNYRILSAFENKKSILYKIKVRIETYLEEKVKSKYDKTIILTKEDMLQWKNQEKLRVIPNFTLLNNEKISLCTEKKVIAVGRLELEKDFESLIRVWKEISNKFPEWKLEIYGFGSEKENLQKKINVSNLQEKVALKGSVRDIENQYCNSSICVMTSKYEGLPLVLLEAMSCGLPLVSFTFPCGPKDIIEDGRNGFLIEHRSVDQMAEKIEELIDDESLRVKMGKEGKKMLEEYSVDKIMDKWKFLFEELLNNN